MQLDHGLFGDHAQQEVWSTGPDTRVCGVLAPSAASSFAEASALQRLWRDANTAGRHAVVLPAVNQEVYGKALLGIPYEENITPLI